MQLLVQVCTSRRWLHDTDFSNPYILPLMHLIRSAIRVFFLLSSFSKPKSSKKKCCTYVSCIVCSICVAPGAFCVRCVEGNSLQEHYEDNSSNSSEKNTTNGYFDRNNSKNIHHWIMQRQKRVRPERQEKEISRD